MYIGGGHVENIKKKYVKVYVTESLEDYIKKVSQEMGMSASAFCVMCVNQYKQSIESLSAMSKLEQMVTDIKTIQLVEKGK